ncbi:hypothetical protein CE91St59_08750 [[Clostridium] scindens]|jgi:hypothetical protein|nr:hypothetical protein CE91St59_08750 [[Clostridium] scindens]BDF19303.1 hypothetical protein CE91St60_08860 [[Clostridium] scindens]
MLTMIESLMKSPPCIDYTMQDRKIKAETGGSSHPVSVRMATDALTMASRKTASEYREKHGSG